MEQLKKLAALSLLAGFAFVAAPVQADLILGGGDAAWTATTAEFAYPSGDCAPSSNSNAQIIDCLEELGVTGDGLLYKDEYGDEEGGMAGYYTVTYFDCAEAEECHSFTLTWDGGYSAQSAYLLVKDGKHDPEWYLFDLTGWNGQETITVNCLWGTSNSNGSCTYLGGAISHVAIFGVPEPGTLALLGLGLIGIAARRRIAAA